jgi:hypothetical protein
MTDIPDARAYPPRPARPKPKAASPPLPERATAVMEARGGHAGTAPSAFGWPSPTVEPPPFGFNAPRAAAAPSGAAPASLGRGGVLPGATRPGDAAAAKAPDRPAWSREATGGPVASATASAPQTLAASHPAGTAAERPAWSPGAAASARNAALAAGLAAAGTAGATIPATTPPRQLMPATIPIPRRALGDAAMPSFGPPGTSRSTSTIVALSVLTLGFYAVAWHRRVNQEMGDFDPRVHVHPTRSAWAVAVPLLIGLLATVAAAVRIIAPHLGATGSLPLSAAQSLPALAALAAVPYLMLLLPFSLVAMVLTAERVRLVEEHAGVTTDEQVRPAALAGWLLVPLIGGFVVIGRQQRALNRIWDLARG